MAQYRASSYVDGLEPLRRDLRRLGKDAGRDFDREAKKIAIKVRDDARAHTPRKTGATARSIGVSSTYKGIAVRSGKPWFAQIEYGAQVWLRRGLPYPRPKAGGNTFARTATGSVPVRQRAAPPGPNGQPRVVNEARYLIRRQRPLHNAADHHAPELRREAEQMIDRLTAKYGLS